MERKRCVGGGFLRAKEAWREAGQSTVEAAFVAPILLGLILVLAQPCIYLYDRTVMEAAASETCRLVSTLPSGQDRVVDEYARRRLASVPQQGCFHVHEGASCSWEIETQGDQASPEVVVSIRNKVKPLPLIDFSCRAVGLTDDAGYWTIEVESRMATQPEWASSSPSGSDPSSWVGGWREE